MSILDYRIKSRYPRTLLFSWVMFAFYISASVTMYSQDRVHARERLKLAEEDAYYTTPAGLAELAEVKAMEQEEEQLKEQMKVERLRKLQRTEEGRKVLEEEKEARLLDLRYRETRIHYELANLAPKIAAIYAAREKDALQRAYVFASPAEQARLRAERLEEAKKVQEEKERDTALSMLMLNSAPMGLASGGSWIAPDGQVQETRSWS